jgi:hypothetical protein
MATLAELQAAFIKADDAALKGDKQAADDAASFAAEIRKMLMMPAKSPIVDNLNADTLNPTKGIGAGQLALEGAGKFVSDTLTGLKQRLAPDAQTKAMERQVSETEARDAALMDTTAGKVGNVLGAVGMSAPAAFIPGANTYAGTALIGGIQGLLNPTKSGDSVAWNTAAGVGGGLLGQAVGNGISRVIRPQTPANVKLLQSEGVTPTMGQILGGTAQKIEDKLTSVPLVGDVIQSARGKSLDELNKAVYRRSLNGLGEVPTTVGRQSVDDVATTLSNQYNKILPRGKFTYDPQVNGEISKISQVVDSALPPELGKRFQKILDDQVFNKMTSAGTMSGESYKEAYSQLGTFARGLKGDQNFDNRQLGDALRSVQEALRSGFTRSNPKLASELAQVDSAYSNYARLRAAAAMQGATEGKITPTQLAAAVKAGDRSLGHGAYARGKAPMQDLSDAAKAVLSSQYPDSGTAGRAGLGLLAAGGGGLLTGHPLLAGAATLPYLLGGRQIVSALLTQRPGMATPLAELLKRGNPALAGGMGASFADLTQ